MRDITGNIVAVTRLEDGLMMSAAAMVMVGEISLVCGYLPA